MSSVPSLRERFKISDQPMHASMAESDLGVALSAYTPPEGQSSFDETIQGDTSNESLLSDTPTVELTSLPWKSEAARNPNVSTRPAFRARPRQ